MNGSILFFFLCESSVLDLFIHTNHLFVQIMGGVGVRA